MIKIQEHLDKIKEIQEKVNQSKGKQRKQYLKCLHRLQKELYLCKHYLKGA